MDKNDVFDALCRAKQTRTLGLFIGSGFSKAVTNNRMPDWKQLLENVSELMGVEGVLEQGRPYPETAVEICKKFAEENEVDKDDAIKTFKNHISKIINQRPKESQLELYSPSFNNLEPSWIVTTNYDTIIEQLLKERAFPITPQYSYIKIGDLIPVYHIHGSVTDPESIVITNDDYAQTLRVSDYRHARLPFLIKESTVLMLGYSLSDINVLSAIDYSKNIYTADTTFDTPIIQVVYSKTPRTEPYQVEKSIIIIETDNLLNLLNELDVYDQKYKHQIRDKQKKVNSYIELFSDLEGSNADKFRTDREYRISTIEFVVNLDKEYWYIYSTFIPFVSKCLSVLWNNASQPYQFEYYKSITEMVLDLITIKNDYSNLPISYINKLVYWFCDVAPWIGKDRGQGHSAFDYLQEKRASIPAAFLEAFRSNNSYDVRYERAKELLNLKD